MDEELKECRIKSEKRFGEVDVRLAKIEEEIKMLFDITKKQDFILKDFQELNKSVSILAINMQNLLEEQKAQNSRLLTLENKPVKRFDSIIDKILLTVITALVTMVLVKLGLQ